MKDVSETVRSTIANLFLLLAFTMSVGLISDVSAFQQGPSGGQHANASVDLDYVLQLLNLGIVVLGIMVTILLGLTAFNILNQYREASKYKAQLEKEISELKDKYKLSDLKTPEDILQLAKDSYVPRIEAVQQAINNLRGDMEKQRNDVNAIINRGDAELKVSLDFILKTLSENNDRFAQLPTKEAILQEVSQKYEAPTNLQEIMLRKVLDAFLRVKNLSDDERKSISEVLVASKEPSTIP